MMEGRLSNDKAIYNVHLSGGSPWGFTLHGGSEFSSKLYIKRITPGGKASQSKVLQVGDEVISVNNIECTTRAKAIEYVKDSGQSLQLTIKRSSNDTNGAQRKTRQNGLKGRSADQYPTPNYYATAMEEKENDFYSTYSVDPAVYAKIVQTKATNKMANSYDSELSASNEDLLNRYRERGTVASEEELDKIEKPGYSNGRLSPNRESAHTLQESSLHGRTLTSPGRIQKVKIKSANISSSSSTFSSPDDESTRHQSRITPVKHSPISRQYNTEETETTSDNWFERWLRDDKTNSPTDRNISVKDACSKFEQERQEQRNEAPKSPIQNRSNFSRSKSFSGRPSYGVVFGTTAVKSNDQHPEINAYQAPLPSTRYSSADLIRDKARQHNIPAESWKHVEVETSPRKVHTMQDDRKYTDRMSRKSLGAAPMASSTSSLDSFGDLRRQGPAIPPRRSESKLLRSMRKGKSQSAAMIGSTSREAHLREEHKPKHSVSNSWPSDYLGDTAHSVHNRQSWPPEDTRTQSSSSNGQGGNTGAKRSTSVVIRSVRTSTSSSDNAKPKIYRSSSVEINPVKTSEGPRPQSALTRPHSAQTRAIVHEEIPHKNQLQENKQLSQQQHHQPQHLHRVREPPSQQQKQHQQQQQQVGETPSQQQRQHFSPKLRPQNLEHNQTHQEQLHNKQQQQQHPSTSPYNEMESISSRIEDTQILQKLMKDNVISQPQSVRSRIQKIEKSSSQPNLLEGPDAFQLKPGTHHYKQRSWDNSYSAFNRSFSNARSELRSTGRFGSTERLLDCSEDVETSQKKTLEKSISPVKVTSMELPAAPSKPVMQSSTRQQQPQKNNQSMFQPINEEVLRAESSSIQEKEVYLEEMFKSLNDSRLQKPIREEAKPNLTIKTQRDRNSMKLSVGDDDVFTNPTLDESLPPPPPPSYSYHEPSDQSLPLPTPPREVLVGEPLHTVIKQDRNRNDVYNIDLDRDHPNNDRYSYKEDKSTNGARETSVNKENKNEDMLEYEDRQTQSVNVKNLKNEELLIDQRTQSIENYINPESKSLSTPKERSLNTNTISKSELDAKETISSKEPPSPIVITSTPTRNESYGDGTSPDSERGDNTSPLSESTLSTPSSSRPGSMMSPKLEQLDKEKGVLVDSMRKKIEDLRTQMNEITDEITENEKLGEKVTAIVESRATPSEFPKYQRFTGELNKIVLLLLSLKQRMHRYENTLQELDMSEEADRQQRDILLDKIDHVKSQYEEACKIKEVNDKRGEVVSTFLENYLDEDEFADFQYYVDMKTQLALMHAEIKDKVKMGEERLNTLSSTSIDWNVSSFCGY